MKKYNDAYQLEKLVTSPITDKYPIATLEGKERDHSSIQTTCQLTNSRGTVAYVQRGGIEYDHTLYLITLPLK